MAIWQPIDTAPRDGQLIVIKHGRWSDIAAWDGEQWCFRMPKFCMKDPPLVPFINEYAHPTHWHAYPIAGA
jgi:hypothetical protein